MRLDRTEYSYNIHDSNNRLRVRVCRHEVGQIWYVSLDYLGEGGWTCMVGTTISFGFDEAQARSHAEYVYLNWRTWLPSVSGDWQKVDFPPDAANRIRRAEAAHQRRQQKTGKDPSLS